MLRLHLTGYDQAGATGYRTLDQAERIAAANTRDDPEWSYHAFTWARGGAEKHIVEVRDEHGLVLGYL